MAGVPIPLRVLLVGLFLLGLSFPGRAGAGTAAEIDADVTASLDRFIADHGAGRALLDKAAGVLVFPDVVKGGIEFGAEYGEGALRVDGKTVDYYNTFAASFGFQFGVQVRTVILMFMTEPALSRFRATEGWAAGVDASIAIVRLGIGETLDTHNIRGPVVAFIVDQKGLMFNLTLEVAKITRIKK